MVRLNRLAWLALLVPGAGLAAQRPVLGPIDTDRPDFTDATTTIARGHRQFELGYTRTAGRTDTDAPRVQQQQELLFRAGVTDRIEFRLSQNFVTITPNTPTPRNLTGFDDLGIGTKIRLSGQHAAVPSLSLEAGSRLPTGGRSVAARKFLPSAAMVFAWGGSGPWSLGSELAGERTPDEYLQVDGSVSLQYSVIARLQLYGEWYTFQPVNADPVNAAEHYADSGILFLLTNDMQIDARVGVGLNHASNKSFFGFGFSFRR